MGQDWDIEMARQHRFYWSRVGSEERPRSVVCTGSHDHWSASLQTSRQTESARESVPKIKTYKINKVHKLQAGKDALTSEGSSSSSSSGLLNIQLATVEFGPPNPSWRAASSTDARTKLESRFGGAGDTEAEKDGSSSG